MEGLVMLFYYTMACVYAYILFNKLYFGLGDSWEYASPRMKFYFEHWYMFFTVWNAILDMIYTCLRICEYHLSSVKFLYRKVVALRSFIYVQFMFPTTMTVAIIFWLVFCINRELVYPEEFDIFVPAWENHVVHTLIVVPLFLDLCCSSIPIVLPNHCTATMTVATYGILFQLGIIYLYQQHGFWMYYFYSLFTGYKLFFFVIFMQLFISFWFEVGYRLVTKQKTLVNATFALGDYPTKKVQ